MTIVTPARGRPGFNRRRRVRGAVWQSRYKAKLIEDQVYFDQLLAYIHLNPVRAGIVEDPAQYRWSGHREAHPQSEETGDRC